VQAARALVCDRAALARYAAALLREEAGADEAPLTINAAERGRAGHETDHSERSYWVELGNELREEQAGGAGLVVERAIYGDLGFPLTEPRERARALSAIAMIGPGAAFVGRSHHPKAAASGLGAVRVFESRLEAGRATDVTMAVQAAVEASWSHERKQRVVSLCFAQGTKRKTPGFFDPCPSMEATHPCRALAVRYRFGGRVHIAVLQECAPVRLPLRSHEAHRLLARWPKSMADVRPIGPLIPASGTRLEAVAPGPGPLQATTRDNAPKPGPSFLSKLVSPGKAAVVSPEGPEAAELAGRRARHTPGRRQAAWAGRSKLSELLSPGRDTLIHHAEHGHLPAGCGAQKPRAPTQHGARLGHSWMQIALATTLAAAAAAAGAIWLSQKVYPGWVRRAVQHAVTAARAVTAPSLEHAAGSVYNSAVVDDRA